MTAAAQQALRRTMELHSATTRFALACNISTKIIEPIQSRCAILRYSRLTDEQVLMRLQEVAEAESLNYSPGGLEAIIFTAEGDMRNALNNMQATNSGFGYISQENVFKVCDQPHPMTIKTILQKCLEGDIKAAKNEMTGLFNTGYAPVDIIGTTFKVCRFFEMNENLKLEWMKEIGFVHMRIAEGVSTNLQLLGLCARLCMKAKDQM